MKRIGMLGLLVALGIGGIGISSADAGDRGYRGRGFYGSRSLYHPPSVHYDYVPHDRLHWTPWRGLHIDRHYHSVPHYTQGHFDRWHHDHIDLNPRFHNH